MSALYLARGAQAVIVAFLAASAIVLADDNDMFDEQDAMASTAQTIREVGSGELPIDFGDFGDIKDSASRIADSFDEVARALD